MTMGDRIKPNAKHATGDKPPTAGPVADNSADPAGVTFRAVKGVEPASAKVPTSSS